MLPSYQLYRKTFDEKKKVQDVDIIYHLGVLNTKKNSAPVLDSSCSQQYQVLLDEVVSLCQLFVSVL